MKKSLLYFALFAALHVGTALLFFSCLVLYAWAADVDQGTLLDAPWVEDTALFLAFAVPFLVFIRLRMVRRMLTTRTAGTGKACALAALATLCITLIESPLTNALRLEEAVNESDPFASGSVLILLTGCLLGPFVEEMVFRGAMTGSLLAKRCNIIVTLSLPSLLFAAVHLNPELLPFYFMYGLIAGWFAVHYGQPLAARSAPCHEQHRLRNTRQRPSRHRNAWRYYSYSRGMDARRHSRRSAHALRNSVEQRNKDKKICFL